MENVIYEPHPVSRERKAELRAQGYRIIDARFAPLGAGQHAAKNATQNGGDSETSGETKAALEAAGVKFHHKANDASLSALLAAFNRSGLTGEQWNSLDKEAKAQFFKEA